MNDGPGPRTLIAGVGYSNLRDASVGPVLVADLQQAAWPAQVEVHDYSFGAIDALHRLREGRYQRAIFLGSVQRGDAPGTIRRYRWQGGQDERTVQERVAEAAQAVIDLEHTLIVASYFGALPEETLVFEVEPEDVNFGAELTPPVAVAVEQLRQEVGQLAAA